MSSLNPKAEALASYLIEVGALYAVIYFVLQQPNALDVAIPITVALIPILAFYAHRLEKTFTVPYFVWAIALGYLFRSALTPLTSSLDTMSLLVQFFGILIIFGGGLDIKFENFKKLMVPILSLSVIGAILTAVLFSIGLESVKEVFALPISLGTIGLLGAILCSTDPAAIIPTIRRLKLRNPNNATVAVAESAVNDVVGTIITAIFAGLIIDGLFEPASYFELYGHLFSLEVLMDFAKELILGAVIGYVSFQLLNIWSKNGKANLASFPFFIGVALISYTLAVLWGGSGYLAAFITGLLFEVEREFKDVERFFVNLIDGFVKPAVFVILGALITPAFWTHAPWGILATLIFIILVRPVAVTVSLIAFTGRNNLFQFRDLLFLDVIRETGVIPAVLLVAYSQQLADGEIAFAIGAWVIISTLIILPLITNWWVKRIHVAA